MNDSINYTMNYSNSIGILFDGLVAIGTILLAVLAIYGERVKQWLFKPKIIIEVKNDPPFVETSENVNSSGEISIVENTTSIKIKVENLGKTTALNCQGLVEKIWCKHSANENFYPKRTITPSQLEWHNNQKTFNITPRIPAYIEIAKIQLLELRSKAEAVSKTNSLKQADLFLSVIEPGKKGMYIKLGKGTFTIPLIIYCDNLSKTQKYYVEVYWNGNDPSKLDVSNFYIKLVEEKNLNKEISK